VHGRPVPLDAAVDACRRAQFALNDMLRSAQGRALGALGLGPNECDFGVVASGPFWRLREYGRGGTKRLIIVAAPIKRPYIWDLSASVSAIRHCMRRGLHVYLLEWLPASGATGNNGLAEYTAAISVCVAKISGGKADVKPIVIGHSLGGTLAAIFASVASEAIQGLVLLGAPLCFRPATSRFGDALVSLAPRDMTDAEPCPGSLLSHMSAMASPDTFLWSRVTDAAFSLTDRQALEIHARVERWALDEVPQPGKLVHQLIEWLYRENRFYQGELKIDGKLAGPQTVSAPTLAVVNITDDVAPLDSVKPFIEALPTRDARIIEYPGEMGVCLQHLGVLIGRKAHAQVWPEIISWMDAHR
jgi:poly[(R)-3-hydroxyalkanoate] polymerase subunit PhaC